MGITNFSTITEALQEKLKILGFTSLRIDSQARFNDYVVSYSADKRWSHRDFSF